MCSFSLYDFNAFVLEYYVFLDKRNWSMKQVTVENESALKKKTDFSLWNLWRDDFMTIVIFFFEQYNANESAQLMVCNETNI